MLRECFFVKHEPKRARLGQIYYAYHDTKFGSCSITDIMWVSGTQDSGSIPDKITF